MGRFDWRYWLDVSQRKKKVKKTATRPSAVEVEEALMDALSAPRRLNFIRGVLEVDKNIENIWFR